MKRMVIDWSVLMHMNWHKMRSPNFEARTGLELAEFARLIADHALYLVDRVQPDELVLAVDASPNWRSGVYARYYTHNVVYLCYTLQPRTWVVQFDRKTFLVKHDPAMDKWVYQKLSKKDTDASGLDDRVEWEPWAPCAPAKLSTEDRQELAEYPGVDMPEEEDDEAPRVVTSHPDWEHLSHIVPKYKGNRATSRWEYETTKEEFKALGCNLAFNLAPLLGGTAVRVPLAEGDDVCAGFVALHQPEDTTVLVSIDSDLHQLIGTFPELRIFDPRIHTWVDKSPERAEYDLTHKILTGDTSDNICGIALRGAASTLGPKTAEKVIEDNGGVDGVWSYLLGTLAENGAVVREGAADRAALERNIELVALTSIPAALRQEIEDRLVEARAESLAKKTDGWTLDGLTLRDFGLTPADLLSTRAMARADKDRDEGLLDGDPISHEQLGAKK